LLSILSLSSLTANGHLCLAHFSELNPFLLQLEAADLQASDILKAKLTEVGITIFWSKFVPDSQYHAAKKLAISVLTMFGSTYSCESAFSTMNAIKTKH